MDTAGEPIWDGNGSTLDPRTASYRDLLIALHTKTDNFILPMLRDHESRLRDQETGRITPAQEAILSTAIVKAKQEGTYQRSLKVPYWALGVAIASLVSSVVLALYAGGTI